MESFSLRNSALTVPLSHNTAMTRTVIRSVTITLVLSLPVCLHAGETGHSTWGYDGDRGPLHWGKLGPDTSLCEKGMNQSPIDLLRTRKTTLDDLQFSYRDAPFHVVNNGHTLQEVEPLSETAKSRYPKHGQTLLHCEKASSLLFDGNLYSNEECHCHTPSEPKIGH